MIKNKVDRVPIPEKASHYASYPNYLSKLGQLINELTQLTLIRLCPQFIHCPPQG